MQRFLLGAAMFAAMLVSGAATVQADHGHHGQGHGYGQQLRYGGGYGGGYSSGYRAYPGRVVRPGPIWHDTTHYDWHGPSLQRHGNHFHVVPGHYDLHRSGHLHW